MSQGSEEREREGEQVLVHFVYTDFVGLEQVGMADAQYKAIQSKILDMQHEALSA